MEPSIIVVIVMIVVQIVLFAFGYGKLKEKVSSIAKAGVQEITNRKESNDSLREYVNQSHSILPDCAKTFTAILERMTRVETKIDQLIDKH